MKKLGQLLLSEGIVTEQQLEKALRSQEILGGRIGTCLLEIGALDEDRLLGALSAQLGVPSARKIDLDHIPHVILDLIPTELARRHRVIPFRMLGTELFVAALAVKDLAMLDALAFATGKDIRAHISTESRLEVSLSKYFGAPVSERFHQLEMALAEGGTAAVVPGPQGDQAPAEDTTAGLRVDTIPHVYDTASPVDPSAAGSAESAQEPIGLSDLESELRDDCDRDEIAQHLLDFLAPRFSTVAIFKATRNSVGGWLATSSDPAVDQDGLIEVAIKLDSPSVFQQLRSGNSFHEGPLLPLASHRELQKHWHNVFDGDVYAIAVRVREKLVAVAMCHVALGNGAGVDIDEIRRACEQAGRAFERFILRSKKQLAPAAGPAAAERQAERTGSA